ncbi:MAG: hypothetical protein ACI9F9_002326, partial [Candidatus Paceibacteria bacterium]
MTATAPAPLTADELAPVLARLDSGEPFKSVFESLLLSLDLERAEHLSLLMREGRGAWLPLLRGGSGEALFVGNCFSGTVHVLAALGFRPHLLDVSKERMRFESHRCQALTGVQCESTWLDRTGQLPFDTDRFEVVVQEEGLPKPAGGWGTPLSELRRVCRGELVMTVNNRLGYKRSLGRRGRFVVPTAGRFITEFVGSVGGERTLHGYKKDLQFDDCAAPRTFSVYPHSTDFTHVVAISEDAPRLHIGPKERKNKLKMAAQAVGLFPWLTPSFAIISTESRLHAASEPRIERVLSELAEISGERRGELDEWIATRGNCVVAMTRPASGDPEDEEGRWCIHIALSPHKERQVELHDQVIRDLWERGQPVPVPEPIFCGKLQGIQLSCERRLPGLTAPQCSGQAQSMRRLLEDTVKHFEKLVTREARPIDERAFARHFDWRFEIVAEHAGRESTRKALMALRDATRKQLLGEPMPLVLQHADLRNKHVQITPEGKVLGY